jgi:hypothetical protein
MVCSGVIAIPVACPACSEPAEGSRRISLVMGSISLSCAFSPSIFKSGYVAFFLLHRPGTAKRLCPIIAHSKEHTLISYLAGSAIQEHLHFTPKLTVRQYKRSQSKPSLFEVIPRFSTPFMQLDL